MSHKAGKRLRSFYALINLVNCIFPSFQIQYSIRRQLLGRENLGQVIISLVVFRGLLSQHFFEGRGEDASSPYPQALVQEKDLWSANNSIIHREIALSVKIGKMDPVDIWIIGLEILADIILPC